jgi:hypothetical protein
VEGEDAAAKGTTDDAGRGVAVAAAMLLDSPGASDGECNEARFEAEAKVEEGDEDTPCAPPAPPL